MRHLVKSILLIFDCTEIAAVTPAVFVFIKMLNFITYFVYYFYLLPYFVFNVLEIRKIHVTLFKNVNLSDPVFVV